MTIIEIIFLLIVGTIGTIIGWVVSTKYQSNKIIGAKGTAQSIIEQANRDAESLKKEQILEAKDASLKLKSEVEQQLHEKSKTIQERENSLNKRELSLDKISEVADLKSSDLKIMEEDLLERSRIMKNKDEKLNQQIQEQNEKLVNISGMSQDQAKGLLMDNLLEKAKKDSARKAKDIKDEAVRNAVLEAKKIIVSAIQRSASDHSSEISVSVVNLPSDSMKGRIIGREGRNIRAFEAITGTELIIDDTPEAVVISAFDPVRRETARLTLDNLVADGRIHPARIEEVFEKSKSEIEEVMKSAAENSILELNIPRLPTELMRLLGKMNYRTSYGQNVLKHRKSRLPS